MLIIKHTVETTASPQTIWDIWQDVKNWPTWDHGIEFSTLEGPFQNGTRGTLKPKGGPLYHPTFTRGTLKGICGRIKIAFGKNHCLP